MYRYSEELGITLELAPPGVNFTPVAAFTEAGFPKKVLEATAAFKTPSPIQAQSWPIVMSGHDMVRLHSSLDSLDHILRIGYKRHGLSRSRSLPIHTNQSDTRE